MVVLADDEFLLFVEKSLIAKDPIEDCDYERFVELLLDKRDVVGVLESYNLLVRIAKVVDNKEFYEIVMMLDGLYDEYMDIPLATPLVELFKKKRFFTILDNRYH